MRLFAFVALLIPFFLIGCAGAEYPPPDELPAEYTSCDVPADCVVVELGCCDACNGGDARSVSRDQASAVAERYAESCGPATACTEMACGSWETTCEDSVCGLLRGDI